MPERHSHHGRIELAFSGHTILPVIQISVSIFVCFQYMQFRAVSTSSYQTNSPTRLCSILTWTHIHRILLEGIQCWAPLLHLMFTPISPSSTVRQARETAIWNIVSKHAKKPAYQPSAVNYASQDRNGNASPVVTRAVGKT